MHRFVKIAGQALLALVIVLAAAVLWLLRPLGSSELKSQPNPASGYASAAQRITQIESAEKDMPLQPQGRSIALLHGSKTPLSVVMFHGFTDVPDQFSAVAKGWYESGANVYVPRMPFHGYADRMTDDPSQITPDVLRAAADEAVDIAAGLGERVVVVGLSGGGAMAAWSAAERHEVAKTVIISPLMLPKGYKPWMVRPLARLMGALPDRYTWWTDKQAAEPGPEYPRYSIHGITSYLMLVERVKADGIAGATPIGGDVAIVTNLSDEHLDTSYPVEVVKPLVARERECRIVTIPPSEGLKHDIVGCSGENRPKLRRAYGYLSDAMGVRLPDPLAAATEGD